MDIPLQLQKNYFRFVLLGKWNLWKHKISKNEREIFIKDDEHYENIRKLYHPLGKAPFEKEWQKNGYKFDDKKLNEHYGNYGCIGGFGKLRILDIDDKILGNKLQSELDTFTVQTGTGGRHFYFISDYDKNHVLMNNLGELRANNYQVVGPGCIHPNGNKYVIVNNSSIKGISKKDMEKLINPFLGRDDKKIDRSRSGQEWAVFIKKAEEGKSFEQTVKEMREEGFTKVLESEAYAKHSYESAVALIQEQLIERKRLREDNFSIEDQSLVINVLGLIAAKRTPEATELIVRDIKSKERIYTTRDDENSEMWIYKEGIYVSQAKTYIKERCREILGNVCTTHIVNQVIFKIEVDTYIEQEEFFKEERYDLIAVENGILNIVSRKLNTFSPEYRFFNKLPIKYDENNKSLNIINFFESILKDKEDLKIIQELFGFILYKKYIIEKAFLFSGSGRNGKGKTLDLIRKFIGIDNCTDISLEDFEKDMFSPGELFKKLANLSGDLSRTALKNTGLFKKLTGRDLIAAARKFKTRVKFENYAKMIFSANEIPITYDLTLAFFNRWIIIDFPYTFLTQKEMDNLKESDKFNVKLQDPNIIDKITTPDELSGLLNWSLNGLNRLLINKSFSYSSTTEEVKNKWIRKSDSFQSFCMDKIESYHLGFIKKSDLRQHYSDYCKEYKLISVGDKAIRETLTREFGVVDSRKITTIPDNIDIKEYSEVWMGIRLK